MATEAFNDYSETLDERIERGKSPLLQITEIKPRYSSETPPPVSRDSSAIPSEGEDGEPNEASTGSQGDYVLLKKNNPSPPRPMSIDPPQPTADAPLEDGCRPPDARKQDKDGDFMLRSPPRQHSKKESCEGILCRDGNWLSLQESSSLSPSAEKKQQWDTRPPPLRPAIAPQQETIEEKSLARSPLLSKFTIDERNGDPNNTLAAIHTASPPRSSMAAQEGRQTLPSLTTALSDAGSPFSAPSPYMSRSASSTFGPPLSSVSSAMSPPNYSSNPSLFSMSRKQTTSASTPSDYTASASTPQSAWTAPSPAGSLQTPLSTTSSHPAPPHAFVSYGPSTDAASASMNGIVLSPTHPPLPAENSTTSSISISSPTSAFSATAQHPGMNGIFRCSMSGCTAAPFQTQYLLNSHMNVHSDQRPHFCPVRECPRGPGGQGFKRKNEMIRHGLVHTSPGYTCPFCPDQTHRYPRPDNLQRHVRVHHMEKDRDDPMLREVLAQRPEGGARGRRRRLGS